MLEYEGETTRASIDTEDRTLNSSKSSIFFFSQHSTKHEEHLISSRVSLDEELLQAWDH